MILLFLVRGPLNNDRTETYLQAIKSLYSDSLQMVVTILTSNRKDRYDAIKKLCCLEMPGETEVQQKDSFYTGLNCQGLYNLENGTSHLEKSLKST